MKRFFQTVNGKDTSDPWAVQRDGNNVTAGPLSGLVLDPKCALGAILENFLGFFSRSPNLGVESEPAGFIFRVCRRQGPTYLPTRNRRWLTLTESNNCRHLAAFLM